MHDLVIRGGAVIDGTGAAARTADVAVDAGVITEIGPGLGAARRELDADGLLVTPGWVDIHTHYDGQVMWDPEVTPSSWHGVTTVVMGNCGVGFAPVRGGEEDFLVELMEAVEDIPGSALHEGIEWRWQSFGEYLDAIDSMPRVLDVAAQVPHAALRAYVLGQRAHEDATADEVREMARLVEEALRAGAVGFSTSRTALHFSRHGVIPGTVAPAAELTAIGEAMARAGKGVFQFISDRPESSGEQEWILDLARRLGLTLTYLLGQNDRDPGAWRRQLDAAAALRQDGVKLVPQVAARPVGLLYGLTGTMNPFMKHPTYRRVAGLPLAEKVAELRKPEVRAALLADEPRTHDKVTLRMIQDWARIFPLGDPPDYEPRPEQGAASVAARQGRRVEEVVLDWLLERDGKALLYRPITGYVDYDHEAIREMMAHPASVLGLSDGGAHCGVVCDASMTTFLLTHWARDRTRGERFPVEQLVHWQTARQADLYGLADRGRLLPGLRADVNLVDFDALRLHEPEMRYDLPAGGRRLVQKVDGYEATVVAGEVTFERGEPTGARPGRLVRG
ncbi:MAG: N-acyl-D-amino-acid deacylase family protein [Acidimicrobiales bacterium]